MGLIWIYFFPRPTWCRPSSSRCPTWRRGCSSSPGVQMKRSAAERLPLEPRIGTESCLACCGERGQWARLGCPMPTWPALPRTVDLHTLLTHVFCLLLISNIRAGIHQSLFSNWSEVIRCKLFHSIADPNWYYSELDLDLVSAVRPIWISDPFGPDSNSNLLGFGSQSKSSLRNKASQKPQVFAWRSSWPWQMCWFNLLSQ